MQFTKSPDHGITKSRRYVRKKRRQVPAPDQSQARRRSPRKNSADARRTQAGGRSGSCGCALAQGPALDALARSGVRFDAAYAAAPITLTSHASLMTGRYPPGHGARHNGMRVDSRIPTIADVLAQQGFATAAFIAAFPLDRRFGLSKGFQIYSDRMPRGEDGRPANERPGRMVVDEAMDWIGGHLHQRFFVWVHLFEPHAPYGNPAA